jgi:hypothetical protein
MTEKSEYLEALMFGMFAITGLVGSLLLFGYYNWYWNKLFVSITGLSLIVLMFVCLFKIFEENDKQ